MNGIHWDKIRILVTNKCNYRCPFCHNEGQEKDGCRDMMNVPKFKKMIDFLADQNLSEVNFSGGEPFLHPDLVEMITYADKMMHCDISCASNLSLITDEQIEQLSCTRVKFNIQFPFIESELFKKSTGNGTLSHILDRVQMVKSHGIPIGLNTVIQSDDKNKIEELIHFSIKNELPLKLLPQIGLPNSDKFKEWVYPIMEKYACSFKDKGSGATRWILKEESHQTTVLYVDSPCFYKDIETCRKFGEIRIHPDFMLQTCILKQESELLQLDKGKKYVINQFSDLWNNFKHC